MNVFQKQNVKKILKNNAVIIARNYKNLPKYAQEDFGVIYKVLDKIKIDFDLLVKFLEYFPDKINDVIIGITVTEEEYLMLFEKNKKLIDRLTDVNGLHLLIEYNKAKLKKRQFVLLKDEDKITLINRNIEYYLMDEENNLKLINRLSESTLIELYRNDTISIEELPNDIIIKIASKDKSIFTKLNSKLQLEVLLNNSSMLEYCDDIGIIKEYIESIQKGKIKDVDNVVKLCDRGFTIYKPEVLEVKYSKHPVLLNRLLSNRRGFSFETWRLGDNSMSVGAVASDISRFLNSDILNNVSENEIIDYLDKPEPKKLEDILAKTYGEHVHKIFSERPNLCLPVIDSASLFDKRIYDNLGIEFINQCFNYHIIDLRYFIPMILSNNKLMNNYVLMYEYMKNNMGKGIETIDLSVKKTIGLCSILKKHDFNTLISDESTSLIMQDYLFDSNNSDYIKNINELKKHFETKNRKINFDDTRENIRTLFGINEADERTIRYFIYRDIDTYGLLDEIDKLIIQIIYMLSNPYDYDYNKLIEYVVSNPELFNSLKTKTVCNKIKSLYIKDFENQITNDKSLEASKIETEEIDGVKVFNFKGNDFNFLISGVRGNAQTRIFDARQEFTVKELVNKWLTMENGVSSISSSLVSESNIYSEEGNIYDTFFGFNTFDDRQLFKFMSTDAGLKHLARTVYQGEDASFGPTFKEVMYQLYEKKKEHSGYLPNETPGKRYNNDGERILPNFILVYADKPEQLTDAIEIVKEFRKVGHNINIYRIYPEYYKDKKCEPDTRFKDYPVYLEEQVAYTFLRDKGYTNKL